MITYNNKDILKSFIGNKRVVRKYLNNKIVYGIPDFAQYYNIQGYDNYEIVGSPTIVDGVVSDFTLQDRIITSQNAPTDDITKYSFHIKFKIGTIGISQSVLTYTSSNREGVTISNTGVLRWQIGRIRGTTSDAVINSPISISQGDEILAEGFYKGNNTFAFRVSKDGGQTWAERTYTIDTSTLTKVRTNLPFYIGTWSDNASYGTPFNGSIDLKETYIKVNGQYWFNGNPNYKELLDCNPNVYLQSDGFGQYIQTNIHATGDTEVSTSFSVAQTETLSSIFSSRTSYNTANFSLSSREQGILTAYYNKSNRDIPNFIVQPNRRTYIDMIKNNISVDNINYGSIANYDSFTASIPLRFFALATSTPSYFLNGKLYRTNIVNGDDKYDFIPVPEGLQIGSYKVPSNGMFDIVEQKFYANSGSGEFIWGVDL